MSNPTPGTVAGSRRSLLALTQLVTAGLFCSCVTYTERCDVNGSVPPDGTVASLRLMSGQRVTFDSAGARAIEQHRREWMRTVIAGKNSTGDSVVIPLDSVLEAKATWTENHSGALIPFLWVPPKRYIESARAAGLLELGDHVTLWQRAERPRNGYLRHVEGDTLVVRSNDTTVNVSLLNVSSVELQPQPSRRLLWGLAFPAAYVGAIIGNYIEQLPEATFPGSTYFRQGGASWSAFIGFFTYAAASALAAYFPLDITWPVDEIDVPHEGASPASIAAFRSRIDAAAGDRARWTFELHGPMFPLLGSNATLEDDLRASSYEAAVYPFFPTFGSADYDYRDRYVVPIDLAHVVTFTRGVSRRLELGLACLNLGEPPMSARKPFQLTGGVPDYDTSVHQQLYGVGGAVFARSHVWMASTDFSIGIGFGIARIGFDRSWSVLSDAPTSGSQHSVRAAPFGYADISLVGTFAKYLRAGLCLDYSLTAPLDVPGNAFLQLPARSLTLGNLMFGLSLGFQLE